MYKIKITGPAKNDIQSAVLYIKNELQNPGAAADMMNLFENEIRSLSEMPERYPLVKDSFLAADGFRITEVKNYLIFYIIRNNEKSVIIQRVLYGRRDWMNILK